MASPLAPRQAKPMHICTTEELKTGKLRTCHLKGQDIKVDKHGIEKTRIHLRDLKNVEMRERNFSIDKHKFDYIICLQSDCDVVYLKAQSRQEMEDWYQALLIPLVGLGWSERNDGVTPRSGLVRTCQSLKCKKPPPVLSRKQKPMSVHAVEGVFHGVRNTTVAKQEPEEDLRHHSVESRLSSSSTDTSTSSEWSSSSKSTENSPTDERLEPNFQDELVVKAPVPCTDPKEHSNDSIDVENPARSVNLVAGAIMPGSIYQQHSKPDNSHYEVNVAAPYLNQHHQGDHQYMALLNSTVEPSYGQSDSADAEYDDYIFNTGTVARDRRACRNSGLVEPRSQRVESGLVKFRLRSLDNINKDGPRPLRSRDSIVSNNQNVVQLRDKQKEPQCTSGRSIGDAPKPLRSKESQESVPNLRCENLERSGSQSGDCVRRSSSSPGSPPLPARDCPTNHASLRRFVQKQQQDEFVTVKLQNADLQLGKRLHLAEINGSMWICSWEPSGGIALEQHLHPGDELIKVNGSIVNKENLQFVYKLLSSIDDEVYLTLRRAPHATAFIVHREFPDQELGIKVENSIIKSISPSGAFGMSTTLKLKASGVINAGRLVNWAITEINWQPVLFYTSTKEVEALLQKGKSEIVVVVQPSDLVRAMMDQSGLCAKCGKTPSPPTSPKC